MTDEQAVDVDLESQQAMLYEVRRADNVEAPYAQRCDDIRDAVFRHSKPVDLAAATANMDPDDAIDYVTGLLQSSHKFVRLAVDSWLRSGQVHD